MPPEETNSAEVTTESTEASNNEGSQEVTQQPDNLLAETNTSEKYESKDMDNLLDVNDSEKNQEENQEEESKESEEDNEDEEQQPEIDIEKLNLPEGIDPQNKLFSESIERFKSKGFSQKQVQTALDVYPEVAAEVQRAQISEWENTVSKWAKEVRTDPKIGGSNLKANMKKAASVLDRFDADGKFKEFLKSTRAGNNPGAVKFLLNIHNEFSENKSVMSKSPGKTKEPTDGELFFPNM